MMKRIIVLTLALLMCLSLFACGKSEDVTIVEGFINDIGTVTLESEHNVTGAFELLNTARETANADQLEVIDALTAEIEEACYPGTHFLMFENVTELDVTLAASNATDAVDIYLYTAECSVGGFTDYFYTDKITGCETEYMSPPPEWLSELTDSGMGVVFYYDDLGNVLVEYDTYKGGKGNIDIFIFYADFIASQA